MQRTHTAQQTDRFPVRTCVFAILRRRVRLLRQAVFPDMAYCSLRFSGTSDCSQLGIETITLLVLYGVVSASQLFSSFKNSLTFAGFSSAKLLRSPMSSDKLYSSGNGSASMAPQELRPKGDAHFRVDGDKSTPGNARQLRRRSLALSSLGIVISFSVLSVDSGEDHCVTIERGPAFSTRVAIARVLPNNLRIFKLSKVITRDQ